MVCLRESRPLVRRTMLAAGWRIRHQRDFGDELRLRQWHRLRSQRLVSGRDCPRGKSG